jgi:hypothetical protein
MKTCVLSESIADEIAVRILLEAIIGKPLPVVPTRSVGARGWSSVFGVLPAILRELHYHTDAEALVVVVDSDFTPVHDPSHEETSEFDLSCRLCALRREIITVRNRLRPRTGQSALRIATGLAVPAIEAWYLCGRERMVSEAEWIRGLASAEYPFTKTALKRIVYGTDRPSIPLETERATVEARRLTGELPKLEAFFPNGFGSLAREVRGW